MFAALSVTAALYLTWWILLTPTQEAWLRRVTNGLVISEIVAIVAICRLINLRNTFTAATLVVLASGSIFTVAHNQLLWDRPGEQAGVAAQRAFFEQVAALPPEARLYAAAWYQSPVAALTTDRRFYDFTRHSRAEIASSAVPQFLVIEEVALYEHGWLEKVLDRCVCEPRFANGGGRIYRIQGIRDDEHQSIPQTIFVTADSQGFGNGFYAGEADMRWASERAEFRLPASDFEWLLLWLHAPEP